MAEDQGREQSPEEVTYTYVRMCVCVCVHMYVLTVRNMYVHTVSQAHASAQQLHMHFYTIRVHTHTHTHTHTHHTHTHLPGVHPSLHEEVLRSVPVAHGEVDKTCLLLDTQEVLVQEGKKGKEGKVMGVGGDWRQARAWQEACDGGHEVNTYCPKVEFL